MASTSLFSLTTLFFFSNWNNIFFDNCWLLLICSFNSAMTTILTWQPYWDKSYIVLLRTQWRHHRSLYGVESSVNKRSRNLFHPRGTASRNLSAPVGEAFGARVTVYGAWALLTSPSAARGSASHSQLPRPENWSTFVFLKSWKPDLFTLISATEKLCEISCEN